ncbi:MAG: hypothetical protein CME62_11585 [Halobacteriovoraceae bacterium]|nr:hypothetical protein [Halobacteriovoraceae bacterium]|tara:strand:+ start:5012 stop:5755 length:744 start_codon:yes stop_codon:yes gene_type:complete
MRDSIEDYQIVIIENLKFHWHDPDIRQLYGDLMQIKIDGYGKTYGDNVISADKADFFGTHLMVCKKGIRLKPVLGYKSVTTKQCLDFHLKFPGLKLVESDASKVCVKAFEKILANAAKGGREISFDYSWAQDPNIRNIRTPEVVQFFRDITMGLGVLHHQEFQIDEMMTCGVIKVKTDLFFEKMGLRKVSFDSKFKQKDLNGDEVHIFHTDQFSDYAYQVAEKYRKLWDGKIVIGSQVNRGIIKKVA